MEMLLEKKISLVQIRSSKPWRFFNYEILKRSMLTLVYESYQIEVSELYAGPLLCAVATHLHALRRKKSTTAVQHFLSKRAFKMTEQLKQRSCMSNLK